MSRPRFLYKYEDFSIQSLLNLKKQIIYFGSPLNFNDPYDCALTPNIVEPTDAELCEVRNWYLKKTDLENGVRYEFETLPLPQLRATLMNAARAGFKDAVTEFLTKRGVACFSEKNDDLLMWSHYGGKYKGFCLEFDTSADDFAKITQVRYVPSLPVLTVTQVLLDRNFDAVQQLFCTKSEAWAYEKEWRAIHNVAGTEYGYPASSLTGVYFGPDIDFQSLEVICLILAGQNESVKLWKGQRSLSKFKVDFSSFTYTSHLEAKRLGLKE